MAAPKHRPSTPTDCNYIMIENDGDYLFDDQHEIYALVDELGSVMVNDLGYSEAEASHAVKFFKRETAGPVLGEERSRVYAEIYSNITTE